ncbi:MAG: NADPH-dependent glutamate synthase, partial [Deltaproteobacteria bacterium]|nr:NADPH-dependent glutamate synthase [Candidatus Anaeroferrophillacea bacterium]
MAIERQSMPQRDPVERNQNFEEVNLGLPEQIAVREAQRCLQCKRPVCVEGCPVGIDIPGFLGRIAAGDFSGAAEIVRRDNTLPAVTGRVCPQETQCEIKCVRCKTGAPVAIGWLERFVADYETAHRQQRPQPTSAPTGKKVACVGAGPAGLTCAGELAKRGYQVTIFEAFHQPGGVLIYGIPEFRLPNRIVDDEVENLKALGVSVETNVIIGRTLTIPQLFEEEGFDAVFVANGAGLPVFLRVPGENLKGVYSANEYLTRTNLMAGYRFPQVDTPILKGDRVCVVGGGNVAMDAVRTSKRLGARESIIVYRRAREQMPARAEEVHHAEEEGIRFEMLSNPVEILGTEEGWVRAVRCIRMELGEPDDSGRRRPVPIPGSEFILECDLVVVAVGTGANPLITQTTPGLAVNRWGYIETDDHLMTSIPGVFAGGDIIRGAATVILAMGDGKQAAAGIDAYLNGQL